MKRARHQFHLFNVDNSGVQLLEIIKKKPTEVKENKNKKSPAL